MIFASYEPNDVRITQMKAEIWLCFDELLVGKCNKQLLGLQEQNQAYSHNIIETICVS